MSILTLLIAAMVVTAPTTFHDFSATTIDGQPMPLSSVRGKVVLVVNVASFCGYTKQYIPLQQLHDRYSAQGLLVMGFPANEFGAQEPGTDAEIKEFCTLKYGVTFPMFSKIVVKGAAIHPLFAWLTKGHDGVPAGEIAWNFEKFLVGKDGRVLKRYSSRVDPMSDEVRRDIEQALEDA